MAKESISILFMLAGLLYGQTVQVWQSSELHPGSSIWYTHPPAAAEIRYKLDQQPDILFTPIVKEHGPVIRIDPNTTLQTLRGMGVSLEETSIYSLLKNKDEVQVKKVLRALIDPEQGIGLNLFRITIGTSDFSDGRSVSKLFKGFYSYQDSEQDSFSIEKDSDLGILRVLRLARQVATECRPQQELRFFASCWSPPGWMKTSNSLIGGTLKKGYEKKLALYFRRFIEAYQKSGIAIQAITLQNEPNFVPDNYPGMKLTLRQQIDLTVASYEEFNKVPRLNVKIWLHDHNFREWTHADTILTVLKTMGKGHYAEATAFHNYDGAPAANMSKLHARHPDKDIVFSEHSEWGCSGMYNIQHYFHNWADSYVYWVTMSTQNPAEHNQGPYNNLRMLGPTMLIQADGASADWYHTPEYYLIGQFSKFIRPGAHRLACDEGSVDKVTAVAFRNPDDTLVLVLVNQTKDDQSLAVHCGNRQFKATVPYKTTATFCWTKNF